MVTAPDNVLLTKQDIDILVGHIPTFGMTTNAVLAQHFLGKTAAAKKWAYRMHTGGHVESAHLGLRTKYHRLTAEAVRLFRIPNGDRLTRPLGPGARRALYGVLAFCHLGQKVYRKLTYPEFVDRFPALDLNGPIDCYYRDTDGPTTSPKRIGYILVDCGRDVRRVTQRLHELITQRLNHDAWRPIVDSQRFVLAVVTTTEAKRRQLEDAIRERQDDRHLHRNVPIRVDVRDTLCELISDQEHETDEHETAAGAGDDGR